MSIPLLFFGSAPEAVPILEALINDQDFLITAVITQPDRPVGRKKILTPTPIKLLTTSYQLPVITPHEFNDQFYLDLHHLMNSTLNPTPYPLSPSLAILAAYGEILPHKLLTLPKYGFLNIHPSLLPMYRGATPCLGPILRGEPTAGVTIMQMDEAMDHGPLVAQATTTVKPDDTRSTLTHRLMSLGASILPSTIKSYLDYQQTTNNKQLTSNNPNGNLSQLSDVSCQMFLPPAEQDQSLATFTKELKKDDGLLPWELIQLAIDPQLATRNSQLETNSLSLFPAKLQPLIQDLYQPDQVALFVERTIRALSPWPGAWTIPPNQKHETKNVKPPRLKLLTAHLEPPTSKLRNFETSKLVPDLVRLEGKSTTSWSQFQSAYLSPIP